MNESYVGDYACNGVVLQKISITSAEMHSPASGKLNNIYSDALLWSEQLLNDVMVDCVSEPSAWILL